MECGTKVHLGKLVRLQPYPPNREVAKRQTQRTPFVSLAEGYAAMFGLKIRQHFVSVVRIHPSRPFKALTATLMKENFGNFYLTRVPCLKRPSEALTAIT